MTATFAEPSEVLFNLQRALEGRLMSDWLEDQTASQGPFPPIDVFQQGDDILAIIELPGIEKSSIGVQAKGKHDSYLRQESDLISRVEQRASPRTNAWRVRSHAIAPHPDRS